KQVRHARIRTRQAIENVVERFGIFATGLAAPDHALRFPESRGVYQHDLLSFGYAVEEFAGLLGSTYRSGTRWSSFPLLLVRFSLKFLGPRCNASAVLHFSRPFLSCRDTLFAYIQSWIASAFDVFFPLLRRISL